MLLSKDFLNIRLQNDKIRCVYYNSYDDIYISNKMMCDKRGRERSYQYSLFVVHHHEYYVFGWHHHEELINLKLICQWNGWQSCYNTRYISSGKAVEGYHATRPLFHPYKLNRS